MFYALVFCTRYTDLFITTSAWNYFFKIFYLISSFYTIVIMRWIYPRTREREIAWKLGAVVLGASVVVAPIMMLIFEKYWGIGTVSPPPGECSSVVSSDMTNASLCAVALGVLPSP